MGHPGAVVLPEGCLPSGEAGVCRDVRGRQSEGNDLVGNPVEQGRGRARVRLQPEIAPVAKRVIVLADDDHLGFAVEAGVIEPVGGDRLGLAEVGSNHHCCLHVREHLLHVVGVGDITPEGGAHAALDGGLVGRQVAVNVGAGHDRARELLEEVNLFVGGIRGGERGEALALVMGEGFSDGVDGLLPGDLVDHARIVPKARVEEPVRVLDLLVAPPAPLTGVAMVDAPLPEVGDAADQGLVGLDVERAADVTESADRLGGVQLPRVMAEVPVREGAHRTDSDAHAAVGAGGLAEILAEGGSDAGFEAATRGLDRDDADHLVADAGAPVAHDAPVPLVVDGLAEVLVGVGELRAAIGVRVDVVEVGVLLEIALAGLVAGWAVQRVVDEVHLKDVLAGLDDLGRVGEHLHALGKRGGTGLDEPPALAEDLNRADAAGAPGAEHGLVAEVRHLNATHPRRFEDERSGRNGHLLPIDLARDHLLFGAGAGHHRCVLASLAGLLAEPADKTASPCPASMSVRCRVRVDIEPRSACRIRETRHNLHAEF